MILFSPNFGQMSFLFRRKSVHFPVDIVCIINVINLKLNFFLILIIIMNTYIAQLLYGYTLLRCILHYCITTPGLRETSVDKKPCLGAYAPASGLEPGPSDRETRAQTTIPQCSHWCNYFENSFLKRHSGYLWLMCGFRFIWCRQTRFWAPGAFSQYVNNGTSLLSSPSNDVTTLQAVFG